jgi:4-amino-4-deoxy-L-arabinose transferase-like glycosyltransferase
VLGGLFIRAIFISQESLWPDEALYMFISQNLVSNPLAIQHHSGEAFFENPPLFMYMLSFLFRIFGVTSTLIARSFNTILGSGTILLAYFIGKHLYGRPVGIISAALLSLNPLHWWISTRILTDVPLTFFIYLSLLMMIRNRKGKSLIFSLTSLATKYPAAPLLIVPFLSNARLRKNPWMWTAIYLLGLGFTIFFIALNIKTGIRWVDFLIAPFGFPDLIEIFRETFYFLSTVVCILFFIGLGSALRKKELSPLTIWIILFGTARFFLPWQAFRISRYTLPLYPGMIILAAYGGMASLSFLKTRFSRRTLLISMIFGAILLYVLSIFAFRGYTVTDLNSKKFVGFEQVRYFFANKPSNVAVLTSSPRQVKYMAPHICVHDLPSSFTPENTDILIREKRIDYILLDRWSPHRPKWALEYFLSKAGYHPVFRTKNLLILEVVSR